jgi:hypothetical protein
VERLHTWRVSKTVQHSRGTGVRGSCPLTFRTVALCTSSSSPRFWTCTGEEVCQLFCGHV